MPKPDNKPKFLYLEKFNKIKAIVKKTFDKQEDRMDTFEERMAALDRSIKVIRIALFLLFMSGACVIAYMSNS